MREIKFRAWNKEKKEMRKDVDTVGRFYTTFDRSDGRFRTNEEVEIMQFTGLQDKNGVDIYEGDILIYQHMFVDKKSVSEVIWNEKYSGFASYVEDDERRYILEKELKNQFEVIGNIYENPELLEV